MTGAEYRAIRKSLGLTQAQMAELTGLSLRGIQGREAAETVSAEAAIFIKARQLLVISRRAAIKLMRIYPDLQPHLDRQEVNDLIDAFLAGNFDIKEICGFDVEENTP